jgi:F0F1-type ATP synthase assembly protein I
MEIKSKFLAIGLVLGAGIGIIAGSAFGSIPMGIVFGGGFGLILGLAIGAFLEYRTEL